VLKICNIDVLLTKREFCTGRISPRGLEDTDRSQQGQYTEKRPRANILQVWFRASQVWLIRHLLHELQERKCSKKKKKMPRTRTGQGRNCHWELSRRKLMCHAKQSKGKAGELNEKDKESAM